MSVFFFFLEVMIAVLAKPTIGLWIGLELIIVLLVKPFWRSAGSIISKELDIVGVSNFFIKLIIFFSLAESFIGLFINQFLTKFVSKY